MYSEMFYARELNLRKEQGRFGQTFWHRYEFGSAEPFLLLVMDAKRCADIHDQV